MDLNADTDFSDEEVFFGRLSLREVRKHILMDIHQKNSFGNDFKIIETNSEPNMHFQKDVKEFVGSQLKSISEPIFNRPLVKPQVAYNNSPDLKSEDSFLEIEKAVTECTSPNKSKINLDNTLDVVDYILNHAPSYVKDKKPHVTNEIEPCINNEKYLTCDVRVPADKILCRSPRVEVHSENEQKEGKATSIFDSSHQTPIKYEPGLKKGPSKMLNIKLETGNVINTPTSNKKIAQNIFKTPKLPTTIKKETPLKRTPTRSKGYEHIASPVATYIKNCPQVPLVKDVHPKKPLPSTSIPKLMKNVPDNKPCNKENVVLPPLAYRSAKKTTVINVNKEKLPQSLWVQKFTSTLKKPVVLKHDHRETARKPLMSQQEDSFADLTLHQAEISVCTQKPAFHNAS